MKNEKTYKLGWKKLAYVFTWFAFIVTVLIIAIGLQEDKVKSVNVTILIVTLIISVYILPQLILLFNHWAKSKGTELTINGKMYELKNGDARVKFSLQDIDKIIEYRTYGKTPWGHLHYWEIIIKEEKYILSSLLISGSTFDRCFWNKKMEKIVVWPSIK